MTFVINQAPRLHKHIANNVYTTSHKNLIKILTKRTKKHAAFSQNDSNYKTPSIEKNRVECDVDFRFSDETLENRNEIDLITNSFARIGRFALQF